MKKKIFITGGAGFIGSHTVDRLINDGEEVTVYDIKPWKDAKDLHPQEGKFTYIEGDICDLPSLVAAMEGHSHVLHLAAVVSVPVSLKDPVGSNNVNVTGMLNVLDAARMHGVSRFAYASSAAVYGEQDTFPVREETVLKPQSPYALHKLFNEQYANLYNQTFGLSTIGLRYFNIFGRRQDPKSQYSGVVSIFIDKAQKGEELTVYGDGSATRDFFHIDNVVEANTRALDSDVCGACNFGSGIETSIIDLIEALREVTGLPIKVSFKETRGGDIQRSFAAIDQAQKDLDYKIIVDLKEGLAKLIM